MNTNIAHSAPQTTATIIQFPVGGRAGLSANRAESALDRATVASPEVMYGSWYHAEAIAQEAAPKTV